MATTYGAMLFAPHGEANSVIFEGLTAKLIKVTIIVAGPGRLVDFDLWDRTSGESLLFDSHRGAAPGDKVIYTLANCTSFKLTAQSRDPEKMWCDLSVQAEALPEPKAPEPPEPKTLQAPTRYRNYPNKTHRRRKLYARKDAPVGGFINLPVADKAGVLAAAGELLKASRLERESPVAPPAVQQVVLAEPLVRKVHRFRYDQDGGVSEIEEITVPIKEANRGDDN